MHADACWLPWSSDGLCSQRLLIPTTSKTSRSSTAAQAVRANPYESVLRLDANDTSFAAAAGWGGGFNSWQQQFDHTKTLAASHPNSGLVFIGDSVTQGWGNVGGRMVNGSGAGTWHSANTTTRNSARLTLASRAIKRKTSFTG